MDPTQAGFLAFLRNVVQIPVEYLPDNAAVIPLTYNIAINTVNLAICSLPNYNPAEPTTYCSAVYLLATDLLLHIARDPPGAPVYKTVNGTSYTYFEYVRHTLNLDGFVAGVIQSTNDLTTGGSYVVPDAFKNLTIGDLSNLQTPYGRAYLAIAQDYGPSEWGIS